MTTLYEIETERFHALRLLAAEDLAPEARATVEARVSELMTERDEKLTNICCFIKNLEADAEAMDAEIKRLKVLKQSKKNRIQNLLDYVKQVTPEDEKWKNGIHRIYYSPSVAAVPTEDNTTGSVPAEYITRTEVVPNKTAIKAALVAGLPVEGWRLDERKNLQVK